MRCGGFSEKCVARCVLRCPQHRNGLLRVAPLRVAPIPDQKYRISMRKLNKYPSTLLGDPTKRMKFWSEHDQAYIFERRCRYVVPILEFYITGNKLQRNEFLDLESFLDEIEFFEMENTILFVKSKVFHGSEWEQRINHFVKDPNSSKMAKIFSTLSLSLTVYSIVQFCLETLQELNHLRKLGVDRIVFDYII